MRLAKLRRLVGRTAGEVEGLAQEADAPRAVIYLPDNGRGDALPGRYGAIVIYDPEDPPPELLDDVASVD